MVCMGAEVRRVVLAIGIKHEQINQPPRIKRRKKNFKSQNFFIACAARSPLDLGGRESPKTENAGSSGFFFLSLLAVE